MPEGPTSRTPGDGSPITSGPLAPWDKAVREEQRQETIRKLEILGRNESRIRFERQRLTELLREMDKGLAEFEPGFREHVVVDADGGTSPFYAHPGYVPLGYADDMRFGDGSPIGKHPVVEASERRQDLWHKLVDRGVRDLVSVSPISLEELAWAWDIARPSTADVIAVRRDLDSVLEVKEDFGGMSARHVHDEVEQDKVIGLKSTEELQDWARTIPDITKLSYPEAKTWSTPTRLEVLDAMKKKGVTADGEYLATRQADGSIEIRPTSKTEARRAHVAKEGVHVSIGHPQVLHDVEWDPTIPAGDVHEQLVQRYLADFKAGLSPHTDTKDGTMPPAMQEASDRFLSWVRERDRPAENRGRSTSNDLTDRGIADPHASVKDLVESLQAKGFYVTSAGKGSRPSFSKGGFIGPAAGGEDAPKKVAEGTFHFVTLTPRPWLESMEGFKETFVNDGPKLEAETYPWGEARFDGRPPLFGLFQEQKPLSPEAQARSVDQLEESAAEFMEKGRYRLEEPKPDRSFIRRWFGNS